MTTVQTLKKAARALGISGKDIWGRTETRRVTTPDGGVYREILGSTLYFDRTYKEDEAVAIARSIAGSTGLSLAAHLVYGTGHTVRMYITTSSKPGISIVDPYNQEPDPRSRNAHLPL